MAQIAQYKRAAHVMMAKRQIKGNRKVTAADTSLEAASGTVYCGSYSRDKVRMKTVPRLTATVVDGSYVWMEQEAEAESGCGGDGSVVNSPCCSSRGP